MSIVRSTFPLGFVWETADPFLFSVHHLDAYPEGNERLGPQASLAGRNLGQDFDPELAWRMYHGRSVPGFPAHPHRGFETVTVVLNGFIDHLDSAGGAGRYGNGDVQWMTAGSGLQHAEMFPLLDPQGPNPLELFQIWLNLPAAKKFAPPHYRMLWNEKIPVVSAAGTRVRVIAGTWQGTVADTPAPDSWAADPDHELAIWIAELDPGAELVLPAASALVNRRLYLYEGDAVTLGGTRLAVNHGAVLEPSEATVTNGNRAARLLVLQGRPIAEPVAQHGPFVMNTRTELQQAYEDYQRTHFGGWPWPLGDTVHPREKGRFAHYSDGTDELPPQ